MYSSRDVRMFEDAEVSRPDIEKMIDLKEVGVQGVVNDDPASGVAFSFSWLWKTGIFGWHGSAST